ncbi:hypothetical protein LY78DRAFT_346575 [Colletotrichum sublineola]|nr:hypothetical protein LY78DRAFT_346575 [Colletotrichum sublineola]
MATVRHLQQRQRRRGEWEVSLSEPTLVPHPETTPTRKTTKTFVIAMNDHELFCTTTTSTWLPLPCRERAPTRVASPKTTPRAPVARTAKRGHMSGVTSTRRTEQNATKSGAPTCQKQRSTLLTQAPPWLSRFRQSGTMAPHRLR